MSEWRTPRDPSGLSGALVWVEADADYYNAISSEVCAYDDIRIAIERAAYKRGWELK